MNFMILVNGAPYHRPFFARVGSSLRRAGHRVLYALDSHYTDYLYPDTPLPRADARYFSEYFERRFDDPPAIPPPLQGTDLWAALYSDLDRAFYSPSAFRDVPGYYERLLACLAGFFDELISEHSIDCVIYEAVSNAFAHVAYRVARSHGAQYFGFMSSRIPGRTDVLDSEYMLYTKTPRWFEELRSGHLAFGELASIADEYLGNFEVKKADYMVQLDYLLQNPMKTYTQRDRVTTFARSMRYRIGEGRRHRYSFQVGDPAVAFPLQLGREVWRQNKIRWLRAKLYSRPTGTEDYFLYPLQFHPESSSSINARYFNDELTNVRSLAISLPVGAKLYVKDHPHAAGRLPLETYREIARFPNVVLVDPTTNGRELVRRARAVITCTSTMGYEAIIFGVPVFTLGQTMWSFYPGNVQLDSMARAHDCFKSYADVRATDLDRRAFVAAYWLSTLEGICDLKRSHSDDAYAERIAAFVVSETTTRKNATA